MAKNIPITPTMAAQIRAAAGDPDLDVSGLVAFEMIALNTKPLNKKGSVFHGGKVSKTVMDSMAAALNSNSIAVPLHTLHQQGDELPIGKLFQAGVYPSNDGEANYELLAQFYLPMTAVQLIQDLNNGIIDEVSVGLRTNSILCSVCGFDYLGADADIMNFIETQCAEGHVVGEDGTHTISTGFANWMETSLVSRGAANNAKIVGRAKARLGQDTYTALAASGINPEATTLFASIKETTMDKELIDRLALQAGEIATGKAALLAAEGEKAALATAKVALDASLKTLTDEVAALKAAAGTGVAEVQAKLDVTAAELATVTEFLTGAATAALSAAGDKTEVPKEPAKLIEVINASAAKLHALVPVGGKSLTDLNASVDADNLAARAKTFKTRK